MPLPTTMKAWRLNSFGKDGSKQAAIDSLEIQDTPVPQLQEKQVLIRVAYAAVNPVDSLLFTGGLSGIYPSPCPYTPGFDVSGIVVDSKGDRLKEGDKVCVYLGLAESCREGATFGPAGAFAEYCAVPEDQVALCGDVALDVAAALPLSGLTAFQALFTGGHAGPKALGNVGKGSKVVVLGGPTAVGAHAIQLAAARGAEVYTTASKNRMPSGQSKLDFCKELGATVFNYKEVDWSEELKGQNIELIFDCGGDNKDWQNSPKVLAPGGRFLTVSNMAADPPELEGRACEFFTVHSVRRDLEELLGSVAAGRHKVPIDSYEDFSNLQVQLTKSIKGAAAGKLMVKFPETAP